MSVTVISLVVWLLLVFLSVTEGIERNWLTKLTTLNAPLRITPTNAYFSSYYYQIDGMCAEANYTPKNIAQKRLASTSDPYHPDEDGQLPVRFPMPDRDASGNLRDPVKGLFRVLESHPGLAYQDFELSGALLRLQLLRPDRATGKEGQSYLTQVSYLATYPNQCPSLDALLTKPTVQDLNHVLYLATHATENVRQDTPSLVHLADEKIAKTRIEEILKTARVEMLKPKHPFWQLPPELLPENVPFEATVQVREGTITRIDIPLEKQGRSEQLIRKGNQLHVMEASGNTHPVPLNTPLLLLGQVLLQVERQEGALFHVHSEIQERSLKGRIGLEGLEVACGEFSLPSVNSENEIGVVLAKSFADHGVCIGDRGYLSYSSATATSMQEHRLPVFVSGFYDPGVLSIGNKPILVPPSITETINGSTTSFTLDKSESNGVLVWFDEIRSAPEVKRALQAALEEEGLGGYWKVSTYQEYDFAKDLIQQFQSDKLLFSLVGILILLVACCNIISLLVLLVNDKKKEIGTLQAMGASRLSIAAIFGICGTAMGVLSSLVGTGAALLTLRHIDSIAATLSYFQGHEAFNAAFFGSNLPSTLSQSAFFFILVATPLLSLLAGLIPAVKACFLRPSAILRSE
ncbi:MAG: ABC transporter permease [Verrucomicrobia bacterium]|nr:ABC transporter permease [Verrucomicrobiota bacterium]